MSTITIARCVGRLAIAASLGAFASSVIADDQHRFCGGAAQFNTPSDLANVEGDLTVEHMARAPASMAVCSYGYWAEKCGDHVTANIIFDKCIAAGYVGAMIWKGLLYEEGNGVEQDLAKAAALFHRAADSGTTAYATLGKLHYATALHLGKGVTRDPVEALKWFQAAAGEGDQDAQEFLRTGHHTGARALTGNGVGVPAQQVQGQNLQRVEPPPTPAAPRWLWWLLTAVFAAGMLGQARRLRTIPA